MATVNLSWTVEGLHDGIRVEREFEEHVDYLDTLPAGTTEFEDDFSISALAERYGVEPENLNLLTYTLTTFRGDKEKSTIVPVPVEDTDPEWIQNVIDNISIGEYLPLTVENDVLSEGYAGILLNDSYSTSNSDNPTLNLYVIEKGDVPNPQPAILQNLSGGDHLEEEYHLPDDFDYTLLHDIDFTRELNRGLNYSHVDAQYFTSVRPDIFAGNTYVTSFALPSIENMYGDEYPGSGNKKDAIDNHLYEQRPTREVEVLYFLSAPFVADSGNHSLSGMSIWVMDIEDYEDGNYPKAKLVPWDPAMLGIYVLCVSISTANGIPQAH